MRSFWGKSQCFLVYVIKILKQLSSQLLVLQQALIRKQKVFAVISECHTGEGDVNLWSASGLSFQRVVWELLLLHILCCCMSGRRWNFCHFYGITQQGVNEVWNKNSQPTQCTDRKKIVFYTCCCDRLFGVILTLHSAKILSKFYNLRSKEQWFLVRSLPFSLFPPTCYCTSKLVMQSRSEVKRLTRGFCSQRKKFCKWISRHNLQWTSG